MQPGGIRKKIHLNDLKLYMARDVTQLPTQDSNIVFIDLEL
jgi:hypothetical protein